MFSYNLVFFPSFLCGLIIVVVGKSVLKSPLKQGNIGKESQHKSFILMPNSCGSFFCTTKKEVYSFCNVICKPESLIHSSNLVLYWCIMNLQFYYVDTHSNFTPFHLLGNCAIICWDNPFNFCTFEKKKVENSHFANFCENNYNSDNSISVFSPAQFYFCNSYGTKGDLIMG